MKTKSFLMTGVLCLATIGCLDVSGSRHEPTFGIRAAEAKDYYTRKRINGKWVTGIFPKKGTKQAAEMEAKATAERAAAEPPKPTLLGLNLPGVDLTYRPPKSSQTQEQQPEQVAAVEASSYKHVSYTGTKDSKPARLISGTPGVQDKPVAEPWRGQKRTKVADEPKPKRERAVRVSPPKSAAERKRADEAFVKAVARPNPVAEPAIPAAVQGYAPMPERNDLLTALQRKARALAEEEASKVTGSIGPVGVPHAIAEPAHSAGPAVLSAKAAKSIRSVTLDYESGIKTIIFHDGAVQEEEIVERP
jgi:hypothetical protein